MKKLIVIAILLITALSLNSCGKTEENEWSRFYGYTKSDIIGHYEANPDESSYPELPTDGVEVYRDVTIDIIDMGKDQNLIRLHIVIPNIIDKTFTGALFTNENESTLGLHNTNNEDVLMTVYKNKQNQVRLKGRERRTTNGPVLDYTIHGFDVIKANNSSKTK